MALHLRSNPAPISGALFVSNPRKRKAVRKNRKKVAVKKLKVVRKRKNVAKKRKPAAKKRTVAKRKNVASKKRVVRKNVAKKRTVKRKNVAKKRVVRKNRKNPARKRKTVARKNRRNPIRKRKNVAKKRRVMRKNRRNPIRKRRVVARKNRKNPMRKRRVMRKNRRNPAKKTRIIRKNPMAFSFLKPVEKMVSKIPLIGKTIAPFTQPALGLMIGGVSVAGAMNTVGKIPVVGQYAKYPYGHAFGATAMGLTLAALSAFLPFKPAVKKALAISFAGAGGAINAAQLAFCGFDLGACADQNKDMLGVSSSSEAVAGLGDGMYYQVQPLSGIAMSGSHDMAGLAMDMGGIDYQSAEMGDAMSCPMDLSVEEGQHAMMGRDAYLSKFGMPSKKMAGAKSYQSHMAGQLGHRWGWLIKTLGYQRFCQLASLPASQRKELIAKLKASAVQASQATFDQELTGAMSGIAMDMSGLAMDMSGLAVDNMAGIAVAGAGI